MNRYNEISTLQYMGSKTRIISHICEPIIKNKWRLNVQVESFLNVLKLPLKIYMIVVCSKNLLSTAIYRYYQKSLKLSLT